MLCMDCKGLGAWLVILLQSTHYNSLLPTSKVQQHSILSTMSDDPGQTDSKNERIRVQPERHVTTAPALALSLSFQLQFACREIPVGLQN